MSEPPPITASASRLVAPTNVGFIGCGWAFDLYMESWSGHPELRVAGAADIDPARLETVSRHYGIDNYESNEALLADPRIDIVVNLTPIPSHCAVTKAALLAGKHVYSEKPVADEPSEMRELFALAKSRGLHLASAPSMLFGDAALTMWKAVVDGAVGKPRLVYADLESHAEIFGRPDSWRSRTGAPWPYRAEFEAGCVLEHAGYHISCMCAIFGPVRSVTAFSCCTIPDKTDPPLDPPSSPDFSVAALKFESGVVGRLTCSVGAPRAHRIRVIGSRGAISAETSHYRGPVRLLTLRGLALRGYEFFSVRDSSFLSHLFGLAGRRVPLVRESRCPRGDGRGTGQAGWRERLRRRERGWEDKSIGIAELAEAVRAGRPPFPGPDFWEHVAELTLLIHHAGADAGTQTLASRFEPLVLPPRARQDPSDYRRAARPPILETWLRGASRRLRRAIGPANQAAEERST